MDKEKVFLFLFLVLIIFLSVNFGLTRFLINKERAELFFKESANNINFKKYPPYIKGIYLTSWTANDASKINHFIDLIKKTELNAVVIDIKEVDGKIVFDTDSPLINELKTEDIKIPNLKEIIKKLHEENIYTIARIVVFKDGTLPKIKPEIALKNKSEGLWQDYKGKPWLDPASKEAWDYHIELAKEAVKVDFDEINFDYVRFPSDGDISNIIYPIWDMKTPKSEIMRNFFAYMSSELKPFGAFLSIDLFGLTMVRNDDMNIGQLLENAIPYFDFICPMVYPSHYPPDFEGYSNPAAYPYEIIKMNLEKGKERIGSAETNPPHQKFGGGGKLRPWLQDFDLGANYDKEMIELEKQAVYDTNSYGWLLWNPASNYTEEALEKSE